ncbi:hypothetical protein [Methylomonas sp. ZR1]|uniref:hypothetical protein n=1 Tax=Methylomonas sp. ZR1 TaxID=1797072 RepID=UPI0014914724|nr:hypothetical protein [Methylomonas sp. ZR1]
MKVKTLKTAIPSILIIFSSGTLAASTADIDKLTTYSVILGRAVACGINTNDASSRVGYWMDRNFPPGSQDQITYLPIFMAGMQHNAEQQASGNSPDNCAAVARAFNSMPWP